MKKLWNWIRRKPEAETPNAENLHPVEPPTPMGNNFSVAPDHTASICHLLLHVHTEIAGDNRKKLVDGTLADMYWEKINDQFKYVSLGLWGKETTVDDLKYAFSKLAYTSEVQ